MIALSWTSSRVRRANTDLHAPALSRTAERNIEPAPSNGRRSGARMRRSVSEWQVPLRLVLRDDRPRAIVPVFEITKSVTSCGSRR